MRRGDGRFTAGGDTSLESWRSSDEGDGDGGHGGDEFGEREDGVEQ